MFRGIEKSDVRLVGSMGSDETPYKMAKVSVGSFSKQPENDEELSTFLKMLLSKGHMVPFEHCVMTFRIHAPIFVFRQLFRYRTASVSERSMRYTPLGDYEEFYTPLGDHEEFYTPDFNTVKSVESYVDSVSRAVLSYKYMMKNGEKKEISRMVLPVSLFSTAFFTINMRNFLHLLDQRLDEHAQVETRKIAFYMRIESTKSFPLIIDSYNSLKMGE